VSHPRDGHAAAIRLLDGGKRVADTVYMHMLLVDEQPAELRDLVMAAATLAPDADGCFNVVRIALRRPEIGLLDYPSFFEEPFPALRSSWCVELNTGRVSAVDFSARENPPILHRKKLLLPSKHPERARFARLTAAAGTERGDGVLDAGDRDYTFHVALLDRQPAPLRILLGCAERLEPLPADADLVKVHGSGDRVSYLAFESFQERALPTLSVLLGKASLMPVGMNGRDRQERFDDNLRVRGVFTQPGLAPSLRVLTRRLAQAGMITSRHSTAREPR
jgi:hypothetical protein